MSDFYIGWSGSSENSKKNSSRFFYSLTLLMILLVTLFVRFERPFSNSKFDYGNQIELEGYLLEEPVISLRIQKGDDFEILPLVGYGKMGPHAALESLLGTGNYQVKLRGTLIAHKGKRFLELTDGKFSVISSRTSDEMNHEPKVLGSLEITGEIMDPKCFFGVMKPGYGKVHKSCAIRCISGQIPPVLAIRKDGEFEDFYFLTNMEGMISKEDLLAYVGKKITINGVVSEIDNWKSVNLESLEMISAILNITTCG